MRLGTLWKPAYLFRPGQIATRLSYTQTAGEQVVRTPWGARLVVSGGDSVGQGLLRSAVHELAVTELLWRLTGPSDLALDVGANVGYFTSLLAVRAARVIAFEPHPKHVERLRRAIAGWPQRPRVELWPDAVSDRCGAATLSVPHDFAGNEGTASLSLNTPAATAITVRTVTLDEALGDRTGGVLKLDIEGHELAALRGAQEALSTGRIRDIVFEDHATMPTTVSRYLAEYGYTIFGIAERALGVDLVPAEEAPSARWDAPNYLATLDPARATRLMRPRRWRSLRPPPGDGRRRTSPVA